MILKYTKTIEVIGWVASLLMAFCALPEVISCFITNNCLVPYTLLIPWFLGELLALFYSSIRFGWNPLLINYTVNIIFISIMFYYKVN